MDVLGWVDALGKDLRYWFRMLGRDRGFTTVALLTLALGIGANTAIFSMISARLLRPLPYKDADRIVMVRETPVSNPAERDAANVPNYAAWKEQNRVFEEIGAGRGRTLGVTASDNPELLVGQQVHAGYLEVLGVKPILGRLISLEDCKPGNDQVIVLSHGVWLRRYGADPHILGKTIPSGERALTVIGVLPADFQPFGYWSVQPDAGFWIPFAFTNAQLQSGTRYLTAMARLKPGVSLERAQAEMNGIAASLAQANPKRNKGWGVTLVPMREAATGNYRESLLMLQCAVAFVLLIACANVAGLLLARLSSRQQEIMVRSALGAARGRLVFQFLTESVLLSVLSAPFALLIAYGGIKVLAFYSPAGDFEDIALDGRVLGFTALISILTGVAFGLIPAAQGSKRNLTGMLKDSGRSTAGFVRQRMRSALVVAVIAIALVLLTGTGLMVNAFIRFVHIDPGFDTKNLLTFQLRLPGAQYYKEAGAASGFAMARPSPQIAPIFDQILQGMSQLPGVRSAALADAPPLAGWGRDMEFTIGGAPRPEPGGQLPGATFRTVSVEFFRTLEVPLLQGRPFDSRDSASAPWVVIINQSMARKYWGDANPVGSRLTIAAPGDEQPREVVGVVRDMRFGSLDGKFNFEMYVPHTQIPGITRGAFDDLYLQKTIVVRTAGDPMTYVAAARKITAQAAGNLPISEIKTVAQYLDRQFQGPRFSLLLLGIFGATAVILAAVGIYGVMAYSVKQRTHEIGVRMALGAGQRDAFWLIVRQGMTLTLVGVAIGVGGALGLTRFIAGFLYGVEATDPITFAVVAVTITGVSLAACAIPAAGDTRRSRGRLAAPVGQKLIPTRTSS